MQNIDINSKGKNENNSNIQIQTDETIKIIPYDNNSNNNLDEIYDEENINVETIRYQELVAKFKTIYGEEPSYISRAPGRVNLIGEHIDYEGFAVLPMAIENDILVAFNSFPSTSTESMMEINHYNNNSGFKSYKLEFNYGDKLNIITPHDWINYAIAGFNAISDHLIKITLHIPSLNIKMLFTGNVPLSSGLSSSSALTVASALAFVKIFNIEDKITKRELAEATISYERSVGTACGGMDQTISIYAEKNKAKLIEFYPQLITKTVNLPTNVSFIIANSLTESTKINTLAYRYNKRVVENKLALAIICKKMKLSHVYQTVIELKIGLSVNFKEMAGIINEQLNDRQYTLEEIKSELERGSKEEIILIEDVLNKIPHFKLVLVENSHFKLKQRLLHVSEEAQRVLEFYEICKENSESGDSIKSLGRLMNQSHLSCRELYECSSKQLDELVLYAMENKAEGARLTGAGWGGCCVIMVRNENLDFLMNKLQGYYADNITKQNKISDFYFKTKACQGAIILKLKYNY